MTEGRAGLGRGFGASDERTYRLYVRGACGGRCDGQLLRLELLRRVCVSRAFEVYELSESAAAFVYSPRGAWPRAYRSWRAA